MSIYLLLDQLKSLNDDEIFYQSYYNAKKTPAQLEEFLAHIDKDEVIQRELIVPELLPEIIPHKMNDSSYFKLSENKSVYLSKHNCYTPAFSHQHEFFEVIYVLSGTCTQTIGQNIIKSNTGDLCLLAPNVLHTIEVFDESVIINILIRRSTFDDIFFNVLRDKSILSAFFMDNLYSKKRVEYIIFHTYDDDELVKKILEMYLEQTVDDEYCDRIISSMLIIFFTYLMRRYKKTAELPSFIKAHSAADFNVLNYIQDNYQSVTLSMTAQNFNFSIPYCSKLIKITTGHTFCELLRTIRLRRSESMLTTTNMTITDISYFLGYENTETFIRLFKKYYLVSPTQYRQGLGISSINP